jgi:hypothetical protein
MRTRLVIAAILMSTVIGHAQTRTVDGVDAFVRGDYQRAAEILVPIVEAPRQHDVVADFFAAAMYDAGLGVTADPLRACALVMRESLDPTTPIGRQASDLAQGLRRSLSQEQFHECVWLAVIGFGHRFQPVTFTLESRHWIRLDLHGATISYEGRERQFDHDLMESGVVFASIEHVELMAGRLRSTRRHFIEAFMWLPRANGSWELQWRLFEVVKTDWIRVILQPLTTIVASAPPPNSAIDGGRMVRLEVNADGDPEWSAVSGPTPRRGVVK